MERIAIVTGGNRGIGKEICRQLAVQGFKVILTARDVNKGEEAAKEIGNDVVFYKLDVAEETQIRTIANYIEEEYGKLDVLVNNAGILIDEEQQAVDGDINKIRESMEVNFYGPLKLIQTFIPLLKQANDARIINLSSEMGAFSQMGGGYPGYRISKAAINALTVILSKELAGTNIKVNAVCPGWVKTAMGGNSAPRTPEKGAETVIWAATANDVPNGKFLKDMKVIEW